MLVAGLERVDPVVEDHVMAAEVGGGGFVRSAALVTALWAAVYWVCALALVAGVCVWGGEGVTRSLTADFGGMVLRTQNPEP